MLLISRVCSGVVFMSGSDGEEQLNPFQLHKALLTKHDTFSFAPLGERLALDAEIETLAAHLLARLGMNH